MQINTFLVKQLKLSHQQINRDIALGYVLIDNEIAVQKQAISTANNIKYKQAIIQKGKTLFYYAYNKAVGVESTLNINISNNLIHATGIQEYFFPIGRLDKASEGLMILTNDGNLYKQIIHLNSNVEKIYEVEVDREVNEDFIRKMSSGVMIMGSFTKPCEVIKTGSNKFKITLFEGKNRQIRRMCHKLEYDVLKLKRVAIGKLNLGELPIGDLKNILIKDII